MTKPRALYEITCRCLQGRFLLCPSSMLNRLLIGVIGRALSLFDLELCFVVFLSNHMLCAALHNMCYGERVVMRS